MLIANRGFSLEALGIESNTLHSNPVVPNQNASTFARQLAESLEGYLTTASEGGHIEIDVLPAKGANLGTRQFLVTVSGLNSEDSPASTVATTPVSQTGDGKSITNEVDAYWATQPQEVQILRTIDDPAERAAMGQVLASKGFTIDPSIMIHRWDPYMTMKIRQGEGYTWVPAVGQDGIPVAPGLKFPGLPSYDPNNPPTGSVRVTTDFARGLEHTSPGAGNTRFDPTTTS